MWVGLHNPDYVTGNNTDLDNLLKWSDGSDFNRAAGSGLPNIIVGTPQYCFLWFARPDNAGGMSPKHCNQYQAYYMCEYECGNGKLLKALEMLMPF